MSKSGTFLLPSKRYTSHHPLQANRAPSTSKNGKTTFSFIIIVAHIPPKY